MADELEQVRAELEKVQKDSYSSEDYQRLAEKIHELEEVRSHSSDQNVSELPGPAELLNQLKGKLPKTKISLREVEAILELLII